MSQGVCYRVQRDWLFTVCLSRDHGSSTALGDRVPDMITVIASIRQEHFGAWQVVIHKSIKAFEVGDLSTGYFRSYREAVSVGNEMDFGCEATF